MESRSINPPKKKSARKGLVIRIILDAVARSQYFNDVVPRDISLEQPLKHMTCPGSDFYDSTILATGLAQDRGAATYKDKR
jgi:hypothetical protein